MEREGRQRLLVGGREPVRFGVPVEALGRIREAPELPEARREVDLPRLFDAPTALRAEDRYAEVLGAPEPSYVRLGAVVEPVGLSASLVSPVPSVLRTTAARWAWSALAHVDDGYVVVVDALRLVRIGSLRTGANGEASR